MADPVQTSPTELSPQMQKAHEFVDHFRTQYKQTTDERVQAYIKGLASVPPSPQGTITGADLAHIIASPEHYYNKVLTNQLKDDCHNKSIALQEVVTRGLQTRAQHALDVMNNPGMTIGVDVEDVTTIALDKFEHERLLSRIVHPTREETRQYIREEISKAVRAKDERLVRNHELLDKEHAIGQLPNQITPAMTASDLCAALGKPGR